MHGSCLARAYILHVLSHRLRDDGDEKRQMAAQQKKAGKRFASPLNLLRFIEEHFLLLLQIYGVSLTVSSLFKVKGQLLTLF